MKFRICALLIIGLTFVNGGARCTASGGEGPSGSTTGVSSTGTGNGGVSQAGSTPVTANGGQANSVDSSSGSSGGGGGGDTTVQTHASGGVGSPSPQADNQGTPPAVSQQPSDPSPSSAAVVPSADSPVAATAPTSFTNPIKVQASLLKDQKGLKITGPCNSYFQVYLVPYLYMNVNAAISEIEMEPLFMKVDDKIKFEKEKHLLQNICANNKTFKLVLYVHEGVLTIKWKVYPPEGETASDNTVDIRKYKMKKIDQPITSMQVMMLTEKDKTLYVESKNFSVMNDIPEKCESIANECFMSGVLDIQKCYHCTLLLQTKDKAQECFKFVSPKIKNEFDEIKAKGEDEENPNEIELEETIEKIFIQIYKKGENLYNEVDQLAIMDSSFKSELTKYCSLMKEVDASGALDNHELGNAEEVFAHITTMLQSNSELDVFSLKKKLKNPAICLQNVGHWIGSKTGLLLPTLEYNSVQNNADLFEESGDYISDWTTTQSANVHPLHVSDKLFCNDDYCDWTKDSSSCIAKIEAGDQGDCATSWLFASKVHLETIKCMKGYDHVSSSALYVANCSNKEANDKCHAPSNPLEFLNTMEETKFLPAESDLPYSYKAVNNVCPEPKSHWQNLWANVKLLDPQNKPNSVSTKGYTAYESANFEGNMDAFIKLVKSEVMNKGSVIAYVKAAGALSYDFNGKEVQSLCGGETPDLAVNIVGYGNYINGEGVKKSYWLLQNSWGKHWGENGNFKVDMYSPPGCQHNFIHTAAVFNVDIPVVVPAPNSDPEINNYYLKNSPHFFSNLYLNKLEAEKANGLGDGKGHVHNSVLYGQSGGETSEQRVSTGDVVGTGVNPASGGGGAGGATATVGRSSQAGAEQPGTHTQTGETSVSGGAGTAGTVQHVAVTQPGVVSVPEVTNLPNAEPGSGGLSTGNGQITSTPVTTTVTHPTRVELSSLTGSTGINVQGITGVLHFLKNVKNGKVTTNFVTYDNEKAIGDKSCSRVQSPDIDKLDDCVKFCEANWDACKGKVSPGYCLTKKRGNNDCFFCFV
uniref:Putative papain-like cysteine prorease n=1 Tax=Plasmodium simiovale TaxID=35085 RepID=F1SYW9_PLASM|nr:putative papain-like cysteine prorease [Plasmodium simiovale]